MNLVRTPAATGWPFVSYYLILAAMLWGIIAVVILVSRGLSKGQHSLRRLESLRGKVDVVESSFANGESSHLCLSVFIWPIPFRSGAKPR